MAYGVLKASENANEGDDSEVRLERILGNDEKVKNLVKFSTPRVSIGHSLQPRVSIKKSKMVTVKGTMCKRLKKPKGLLGAHCITENLMILASHRPTGVSVWYKRRCFDQKTS